MIDELVDAAATYRLTKLVVEDYITEPLRQKVFDRFGDPSESKVSYLITCSLCTSVWAGAAVVTARTLAPRAWRPIATALAYAAVTGYIEEHS